MGIRSSATRVCVAALVAVVLAALLAPAPAGAWDGRTRMQGGAAGMGQTNGTVWALEMARGRIYAGGRFTSTRPSGAAAGQQETGQGALAAFDASTGAPVRSFSPDLRTPDGAEATVWATALSPDSSTLYVGGDFTAVDGRRASRIAAFDAASGRFLGPVGTGVDARVDALAVHGTTLYVSGRFTRAGDADRRRLAAFDLTTGEVRAWRPTVGGQIPGTKGRPPEALRVASLAVSADGRQVYLAGPFRQLNGSAAQGFGATRAADGGPVPGFRSNHLAAPYGWGTVVEVAGGTVYLGGRDDGTAGKGRREGVHALTSASGAVRWYANCYGDTFGIQVIGNELYVASHAHDCAAAGGHPETSPRTYLAIHAVNRANGRVKPYFVQTSGGTPQTRLLSRALATDGEQLVMGGGFARVNTRLQSNLTRFRTGSSAPEPRRAASASSCRGCAYATVRFSTWFDRDDVQLRYQVFRGAQTTQPIRRFTRESVLWRTGRISFRDRAVKRGQKVFYRVRVVDPTGASRLSGRTRTVTVGRG